MEPIMQFDDTRVLVTGGSSGIGLAVARAFLAASAKVAIAARDAAKLQAAAKVLKSDRLTTHAADVSDLGNVQRLISSVTATLGGIDILVNNAGTNIKARTFRELTPDSWSHLIRTNLDSAFHCIHCVLPQMLERKSGFICNINSIAGRRAWPVSGPGYVASKFAMSALGICLGAEERESGIRVTNIYPGEVDTPLMRQRPQPPTPEQLAKLLQPEDVAASVLFAAGLPPRAHVPELVIKPTTQYFI
jgi:NADP-dependent 3-hydroxy acid dehydrogenase YdfG